MDAVQNIKKVGVGENVKEYVEIIYIIEKQQNKNNFKDQFGGLHVPA